MGTIPPLALSLIALALAATAARVPAESVALPAPRIAGALSVEQALASRRSVRDFASTPLTLEQVGQLLWAAQGENRPNGHRTAPSAGATYPLELRLAAGEVEGLATGLYRYVPSGHRLERLDVRDLRLALVRAAREQAWMAEAPALFAISGAAARTAARYGERAERYVPIEVGHAAENLLLQAVALGLGSTPVGAFDDRAVENLLALGAGETPYLLLPVGKPR